MKNAHRCTTAKRTWAFFVGIALLACVVTGCVAFPGNKLRDVPPLTAGMLKSTSPVSYQIVPATLNEPAGLAAYESQPRAYTNALDGALSGAGAKRQSSVPASHHVQITTAIESRNAACEWIHSSISWYSFFLIPYYSRHTYVLDAELFHLGEPVRRYRYAEDLHYWGSFFLGWGPPNEHHPAAAVDNVCRKLAAALITGVNRDLAPTEAE